MIVVDASVLAPALLDDEGDGAAAREALRGDRVIAPHLIDCEVLAVIRRARARGDVGDPRALKAVGDLVESAVIRVAHASLVRRIWELRHTLTPYDASYVALAELVGCPLVTSDRRLARAPGTNCEFTIV